MASVKVRVTKAGEGKGWLIVEEAVPWDWYWEIPVDKYAMVKRTCELFGEVQEYLLRLRTSERRQWKP